MGARRDSRYKSAHTASLPLCENLEQYVGVDHMDKSWRHCRYFFGNPNGRRIGIGVSLTPNPPKRDVRVVDTMDDG